MGYVKPASKRSGPSAGRSRKDSGFVLSQPGDRQQLRGRIRAQTLGDALAHERDHEEGETRGETALSTITLEVLDREKVVPLLQAALERQTADMEIGILKTRRRIEEFEQKYGRTLERLDTSSLPIDPLERVEWEGEVEMLRRLELEKELLRTIRICG